MQVTAQVGTAAISSTQTGVGVGISQLVVSAVVVEDISVGVVVISEVVVVVVDVSPPGGGVVVSPGSGLFSSAHLQIASVASMVLNKSPMSGQASITQGVAILLMAAFVSGSHLQR